MKNTEREILEKAEANAKKFSKDGSRPKLDKPKEKLDKPKDRQIREKSKLKTEKKTVTESTAESNKPDVKQETQQSQQPKKTISKEEITPNSENPGSGATSPKAGEAKGSTRKRNDNDSTDKERKIRNKDRPAIQIYRPGAKRVTVSKSVSQVS